VSGTSSASNRDFILQLGASQHIDYEKQNFEDSVSNMDFVLDAIGGNYIDKSLNVLKPGGTIISIPSDASENVAEKANEKGMTGIRFMVSSNGQKMQEIADLLFQGKIKSHISTYYHLNEIRDAHMQIETKKTRGKIIVTL
jgi:NADPH:quinone reductase-like Zn-dependent oxidoreductase